MDLFAYNKSVRPVGLQNQGVMTETSGDVAELARLEARVKGSFANASTSGASVGNPDALKVATDRAWRDRDAVTSPALKRHAQQSRTTSTGST